MENVQGISRAESLVEEGVKEKEVIEVVSGNMKKIRGEPGELKNKEKEPQESENESDFMEGLPESEMKMTQDGESDNEESQSGGDEEKEENVEPEKKAVEETRSCEMDESEPEDWDHLEVVPDTLLCTPYIDITTVPLKPRSTIAVYVNGYKIYALIDTGADHSFISQKCYEKIPRIEEYKQLDGHMPDVTAADARRLKLEGVYKLPIEIGDHQFNLRVVLMPDLVRDMILGTDFCRIAQVHIDYGAGQLCIQKSHELCTIQRTQLAPGQSCTIPVEVNPGSACQDGTTVMTGPIVQGEYPSLVVESTLSVIQEGKVLVEVSNPTDEVVEIYDHSCIATLEVVPEETEDSEGYICLMVDQLFEPKEIYREMEGQEQDRDAGFEHNVIVLEDYAPPVDFTEATMPMADLDKIKEVFREYSDVFVGEDGTLGETDLITHYIKIKPNQVPIWQKPYSVGHNARVIIQEQVQDMLDKGIIKYSDSPWGSPVVLVNQKDRPPRFCVDYRKVNAVTTLDPFPMPDVRRSLEVFGEAQAKYFSTLDMKSAYWQVRMHPESAPVTAFVTSEGTYEFNVLPFGLSGAPSTFSRLMSRVLEGLIWNCCLVYLDDIIVFSRDVETHVQALRAVFQRLRDANLKLSPKKCFVAKKSVKYLGHIVSQDGIRVNPDKTTAVSCFPQPSNATEVRQFLGLAGYYRRFIQGFSQIARPLHLLTKKDAPFLWNPRAQEAFETLKRLLTSAPILAYPRFHEPYLLYTDASGIAVGFVLSQEQDGKEKVIEYGGRALHKHELNYTVTELEFLAVIYAIQACEGYIQGVPTTVVTDHISLNGLIKNSPPKGRLARWILALQGFLPYLTIEYRPGKKHGNADACSRRIYPEEDKETRDTPDIMCAAMSSDEEYLECVAVQTRSGGKVPLRPRIQYQKFRFASSILVTVNRGKAVQNQGDVLINPVALRWQMDGAPARDVSRYGGPDIEQELMVAEEEGPVCQAGQTYCTTAGSLNYRHIIHVVRPSPGEENVQALQLLEDTIYNALKAAAEREAKIIVMPCICIGTFGYGRLTAAAAVMRAIWDFCRSTDRNRVSEIRIIDSRVGPLKNLAHVGKNVEITGKPVQELPREEKLSNVDQVIKPFMGMGDPVTEDDEPPRKPRETRPSSDLEKPPERTREEVKLWPVDSEKLRAAQEQEPVLLELIQFLEGEIPKKSKTARRIRRISQDYVVKDRVLYHIWTQKGKGKIEERTHLQLVVPVPYRRSVMSQYHQHPLSGHRGFANTYLSIKFRYFWKGMSPDIAGFIKQCYACARSYRARGYRNALLQETSAAAAFQRMHADILGPLATSEKGYKYVLVMVDSFTRWVELTPLKNQTASTVATCIYNGWICRHGVPREIVTDKGTNFLAQIVKELAESLRIQRITTSSYHPQANGLCERRNAVIVGALKKMVQNNPAEWPSYLPSIQFAINTTLCSSTRYSPYYLVYGRAALRPIDIVLSLEETPVSSINDHLTQLMHKIYYHERIAQEWDQQSRAEYKKYYDRKVREDHLKVGDFVWIHVPAVGRDLQIGRKLRSPWDGPYQIVAFKTPVNVIVKTCPGGEVLETSIHVNRLKPFVSQEVPPEEIEVEEEDSVGPDM